MTPEPKTAVQAVAAVTADIEAIAKANKGHGYFFRGIDDLLNTLHPLLAKHGVVIAPNVVEAVTAPANGRKPGWDDTRLKVVYNVYGPDGSSITAAGYAQGLSNQGTGSGIAMSYAYKSMALQLFCIPTEGTVDAEDTPEAEGVEPLPKALLDELSAVFAALDGDLKQAAVASWKAVYGDPRALDADLFDSALGAAHESVAAARAAGAVSDDTAPHAQLGLEA